MLTIEPKNEVLGPLFQLYVIFDFFTCPLIGIKILLHQKYGFMMIPEKVLRSRTRNQSLLKDISLLVVEKSQKPLNIGKFPLSLKMVFKSLLRLGARYLETDFGSWFYSSRPYFGSTMKPCNKILTPVRGQTKKI